MCDVFFAELVEHENCGEVLVRRGAVILRAPGLLDAASSAQEECSYDHDGQGESCNERANEGGVHPPPTVRGVTGWYVTGRQVCIDQKRRFEI